MAILKMPYQDIFAIEMNGYVVIESQDRECALGLGLGSEGKRSAVPRFPARFETLANIVLRDEWRLYLEVFISICVVVMIVGVDHESNWFVGNSFERSLNLPGKWCVLIIDKNNPIVSDVCSDVAAFSNQQVNVPGNSCNFDVDLT